MPNRDCRDHKIVSGVLACCLGIAMAAGAFAAQAPQESDPPQQEAEKVFAEGYTDTEFLPGGKWRVHDLNRPHPRVVAPGTDSTPERAGRAPSDAVVLFDGKDLSKWITRGKRKDAGKVFEPQWKVENGYIEMVAGTGDLASKEEFGDCQIHVEWAAPAEVRSNSQGRGNSGVLMMGRYEIQVLDSWENVTYADGQAASIYAQYPPLVNASRKPGEWQSFDIVFEAPRFEGGKVVKPAYVTVFHNGVLTHHRQAMLGPMRHKVLTKYEPHGPEGPLVLQSHGNPVRYRNIWVRRLTGYDEP
jgi:hypothetical protein